MASEPFLQPSYDTQRIISPLDVEVTNLEASDLRAPAIYLKTYCNQRMCNKSAAQRAKLQGIRMSCAGSDNSLIC